MMLQLSMLALLSCVAAYPIRYQALQPEGEPSFLQTSHANQVAVQGGSKAYFAEFSGGVEIPIIGLGPANTCTALGCLSIELGGSLGGEVTTGGQLTAGGGFSVALKLKLALVFDVYISAEGKLEFESTCTLPAGKTPEDQDLIFPTIRNWGRDLFFTNGVIRAINKLGAAHKAAWKAAGLDACQTAFLENGHDSFPRAKAAGAFQQLAPAFLELDKSALTVKDFEMFHESLSEREQLMMYEEGIMNDIQSKEKAFYKALNAAMASMPVAIAARYEWLAGFWFDNFLHKVQAQKGKAMVKAYYKNPTGKNEKLNGNLACDPTSISGLFRDNMGSKVDILLCRYAKTNFLETGEDETKTTIGDLMTKGFPQTYPRLFSPDADIAKEAIAEKLSSDKFYLLVLCPQNFQDALAKYKTDRMADIEGVCQTSTVELTGRFSAGASVGFANLFKFEANVAMVGKKIWQRATSGDNAGKMVGSAESGWFAEVDAGGKMFGWSVNMASTYDVQNSWRRKESTFTICTPCPPSNLMTSNVASVSAPGTEALRALFTSTSNALGACTSKANCVAAGATSSLNLLKWIFDDAQDPFWAAMGLGKCTTLSEKSATGAKLEAVSQYAQLALAIKNAVIEGFEGNTALPEATGDSSLCVDLTVGQALKDSSLSIAKVLKLSLVGGNSNPTSQDAKGPFLNLGGITAAGDTPLNFAFTAGSAITFEG